MPSTQLPTSTPSMPNPSMSLAVDPIDPGIGDEMGVAGLAFGDLIEHTGNAVAQTQNQLNLTGAATAQALANTLIDVIAVEETNYDEFGEVDTQVSHTRQLPLINFIDPVFYEWSHVRLQGQFYAREFSDSTTAHSNNYSSQNNSEQHGLLVFFGGGRTSVSSRERTTDANRVNTSDVSIGRMRMNALLRPRSDVSIPKPTQVIQGPNIVIMQGAVTEDSSPGFIASRSIGIAVQYLKRDGTPIVGKLLNIETDGLVWEFDGASTTDSSGLISITIYRTFLDADVDSTPANFVLSVRKGMVANDTTIQL